MKNKKILLILLLILLFLICCLVYLIYYDYNRKKENDDIVEKAIINYNQVIKKEETNDDVYTENNIYLKNHLILGTITIPSLEIEYPIIEHKGDYSLNISITKYYGNEINKNGVVALAGHASRNGMFFGKLKYINVNDEVIISNEFGEIHYYVNKIFTATNNNFEVFTQYEKEKKVVNLICCKESKKTWLVVELFEKE